MIRHDVIVMSVIKSYGWGLSVHSTCALDLEIVTHCTPGLIRNQVFDLRRETGDFLQ